MPQAIRSTPDHRIFGTAELTKVQRSTLLHARSFPPGPERNYHRRIASSLRSLFANEHQESAVRDKQIEFQPESVMAGVYFGVTVAGLYTLVGMGLIILFM